MIPHLRWEFNAIIQVYRTLVFGRKAAFGGGSESDKEKYS